MRFKPKEVGILKELLKQVKIMDKRLRRVDKAVPFEILTKADLKDIEKSEDEIRKGKYITMNS